MENLKNKTLNNWAGIVYGNAVNKGFHDDNESVDSFIERATNNIHDEVCELHNAWRNNKLYGLCDKAKKMKELGIEPLNNIEEECADIIIRSLDMAARLGLDVEDIVLRKHQYNTTREYRHGGKRS